MTRRDGHTHASSRSKKQPKSNADQSERRQKAPERKARNHTLGDIGGERGRTIQEKSATGHLYRRSFIRLFFFFKIHPGAGGACLGHNAEDLYLSIIAGHHVCAGPGMMSALFARNRPWRHDASTEGTDRVTCNHRFKSCQHRVDGPAVAIIVALLDPAGRDRR